MRALEDPRSLHKDPIGLRRWGVVFSIFSIVSNLFRDDFTVKTHEYLKKLSKIRPVWHVAQGRFDCENTGKRWKTRP